MSDSLRDRYNLDNRRRHGEVTEYPFIVNLFPSLYVNASGAFAEAPFQMSIPANDEKSVPFVLPRDAIFKCLYFKFDVTAPLDLDVEDWETAYVSARLTDILIYLAHNSGGDRVHFEYEQLGVFCGTNQGFAQVKVPYIHPKEGSLTMKFKNIYPVERRVTGWFYGMKVAS